MRSPRLAIHAALPTSPEGELKDVGSVKLANGKVAAAPGHRAASVAVTTLPCPITMTDVTISLADNVIQLTGPKDSLQAARDVLETFWKSISVRNFTWSIHQAEPLKLEWYERHLLSYLQGPVQMDKSSITIISAEKTEDKNKEFVTWSIKVACTTEGAQYLPTVEHAMTSLSNLETIEIMLPEEVIELDPQTPFCHRVFRIGRDCMGK